MNKKATLDIYRTGNGEWRWRVKHGNGKIVAASSEGFSGKSGAKRNFKRALVAIAEAAGF
jgi:uncharacterized protein YegP (UPF0339 family)